MPKGARYNAQQMIAAITKARGVKLGAAKILGCDWHTVDKWVKEKPTVAKAYEQAREQLVDRAELQLNKSVDEGDTRAVHFVLRTLGKNRGYVERQEVTGADGEPVKVNVQYIDPDDAAAD